MRKFNLIDEPWIKVMTFDQGSKMVSLRELLLHSQEYRGLAGESDPQDAAVLRILEGIVHPLLTRYEPSGEKCQITDLREARTRWAKVWRQGSLPKEPVNQYLDEWYDRFWLVDDERPFMQCLFAKERKSKIKKTRKMEVDEGVQSVAKLDGCRSESGNKIRLFQGKSGAGLETMTYDEAIRWLLHLIVFDDAAVKETAENKALKETTIPGVTPGVAWGGQLGLLMARGNNLFETLMLNCVMAVNKEVYEPDAPYWEKEEMDRTERHLVTAPRNFSALMTFPSRKVLLVSDGEKVTGFYEIWGDYFPTANATWEPFTIWKEDKKTKDLRPDCQGTPQTKSPKLIWRDFQSRLVQSSANKSDSRPGVCGWLDTLSAFKLIPNTFSVELHSPLVAYGSNFSSIRDVSSQSMTLCPAVFQNDRLISLINDEGEKIDRFSKYAGFFSKNLYQALGKREADKSSTSFEIGQKLAYQLMDEPFRNWIGTLNPVEISDDGDEIQQARIRWIDQALNIAKELEKQLIRKCGAEGSADSLLGRRLEDGNGKVTFVSIPQAKNVFWGSVTKMYSKEAKKVAESRASEESEKNNEY